MQLFSQMAVGSFELPYYMKFGYLILANLAIFLRKSLN